MKVIMILAFFGLAFGISSCTKCNICTKSNATDVRVCEKDYDSNTAYGLAIDFYELQGYGCKKSL